MAASNRNHRGDSDDDPLAPIEGVMNGCGLSVLIWFVVGLIGYVLLG